MSEPRVFVAMGRYHVPVGDDLFGPTRDDPDSPELPLFSVVRESEAPPTPERYAGRGGVTVTRFVPVSEITPEQAYWLGRDDGFDEGLCK